MRSVLVDIYIVTDDSVCYLNLPLRWTAESDSIYPDRRSITGDLGNGLV